MKRKLLLCLLLGALLLAPTRVLGEDDPYEELEEEEEEEPAKEAGEPDESDVLELKDSTWDEGIKKHKYTLVGGPGPDHGGQAPWLGGVLGGSGRRLLRDPGPPRGWVGAGAGAGACGRRRLVAGLSFSCALGAVLRCARQTLLPAPLPAGRSCSTLPGGRGGKQQGRSWGAGSCSPAPGLPPLLCCRHRGASLRPLGARRPCSYALWGQ